MDISNIDTTALLSKSMIFITIYFLIGVAITFYQLYLNSKQAKVYNEVKDLNKTTKEIKELLVEIVGKTNPKWTPLSNKWVASGHKLC